MGCCFFCISLCSVRLYKSVHDVDTENLLFHCINCSLFQKCKYGNCICFQIMYCKCIPQLKKKERIQFSRRLQPGFHFMTGMLINSPVLLVILDKEPETGLTTRSARRTKGPFTAAYLCHVQNHGLAGHPEGEVYIVLTGYSMLWIESNMQNHDFFSCLQTLHF